MPSRNRIKADETRPNELDDAALSCLSSSTRSKICRLLRVESLPLATFARIDAAIKVTIHEDDRRRRCRFSSSKDVADHFKSIENASRKLLSLMRDSNSAEGLFLLGPRRGRTLESAKKRLQALLEDLDWATDRAARFAGTNWKDQRSRLADRETANYVVGLLPAANPMLNIAAGRLWPILFEIWEKSGNRVTKSLDGQLHQFVCLIHDAGGLMPPAESTLMAAIDRWNERSAPKSGKKSRVRV